jgi:hypothetical protein
MSKANRAAPGAFMNSLERRKKKCAKQGICRKEFKGKAWYYDWLKFVYFDKSGLEDGPPVFRKFQRFLAVNWC